LRFQHHTTQSFNGTAAALLRFTFAVITMGLAPLLVDTYHKYKKGTNNFVQWLAETARATGTIDHVFKNGPKETIPASGGRLKGAARKQAKKAGLMQNATTYQIPIKSFKILAEAIAMTGGVQVPASVFMTLRAVIRGRKGCASWYGRTSDPDDNATKENNAGHNHFIEVLEDVLAILKVKQIRVTTTPTSQGTPTSMRLWKSRRLSSQMACRTSLRAM
jgi:hypothetical protein